MTPTPLPTRAPEPKTFRQIQEECQEQARSFLRSQKPTSGRQFTYSKEKA